MIPKFRAWDKTENLMSDVREISFFDKYVELESGVFRGFDEVALMQSTGLTDKHTVDVYQGDIVWDDMNEEYGVVRIEEAKTIIEWDIYVEDLFD
ncbi:YopX family protein, partial [Staphylococcus pseudintermedius]|uniref:YopX family protein n=1 Tax=Staphylococcus pseudintermedius TaxID=283734 RepID=UPI000C1C0E32